MVLLVNLQLIAGLYFFTQILEAFERDQKSAIHGVSVENTCVGGGDDRFNSCYFQACRSMLPGGATPEVVTCDNDGEFAFCPVFTGEGNIPVREARLRSWYTREGILSVHFSLFGIFQAVDRKMYGKYALSGILSVHFSLFGIFQAVDQVGSRNNLVGIYILAQNKGFPFYGF